MLLGTPWSWTIFLNNKSTILATTLVLWQDIKYVIFDNISAIIKIKSLPFFFYLGKPKIKLIDILTQGFLDTGKGLYKPISKTLDLDCLYVMHLSQILLTSHFILS
jgi:hypothetical protein